MMLLLLSLLVACGPTASEACIAYLEARCACDACDGDTPETREQACADALEEEIAFYECRTELLESRGAACRRDLSTDECIHLAGDFE